MLYKIVVKLFCIYVYYYFCSLWDDVFLLAFEKAMYTPLHKGSLLDPNSLDNFHPNSNVSFLEKAIQEVILLQLQKTLEEMDYLDLFQLGFKHVYRIKMALITLSDGICWEKEGNSALDIFQLPSMPSSMVSSWTCSKGWGWAALCCVDSSSSRIGSSCKAKVQPTATTLWDATGSVLSLPLPPFNYIYEAAGWSHPMSSCLLATQMIVGFLSYGVFFVYVFIFLFYQLCLPPRVVELDSYIHLLN